MCSSRSDPILKPGQKNDTGSLLRNAKSITGTFQVNTQGPEPKSTGTGKQ